MGDLLQINPSELKFRFELRKQVPTNLRFYNPGTEHVAFKVKTTTPKKYIVRPNTGTVAPGGTTEVIVIMQALKETPPDLTACKDKFQVLSAVVPSEGGAAPNPTAADFTALFGKDSASLCQTKLKVSYVQPVPPPSPVPEEDEAAAAADDKSGAGGADMSAKYASAMSSLAAATSERNTATAEKEKVAKDLSAMSNKVSELTTQLASASSAGAGTATVAAPTKAQVGFTLLHLLLTAILAFIVGRYT